MPTTKRELAESLGVTKQTVANYIERLELGEHVSRAGKYDIVDDYAAAVLADAIAKRTPPKAPAKADAPSVDGGGEDAVIRALSAHIDDLKEQNADLRADLERERRLREEDAGRAREAIAQAQARADGLAEQLERLVETQQAIVAAPWWCRGRVARKLLGDGQE